MLHRSACISPKLILVKQVCYYAVAQLLGLVTPFQTHLFLCCIWQTVADHLFRQWTTGLSSVWIEGTLVSARTHDVRN